MPTSTTPAAKTPRAPGRLPAWLHWSDLQGLAQLATQATLGVAGLAEGVQGNVYKAVAACFGPLGAAFIDAAPGRSGVRSGGITGRVYGGIRGATRLAGGAVNAVLLGVAPLAGTKASSRQREALLAALNGVLGDHLHASANPLAVRMSLRHEGQPLLLEQAALAQRLPGATGKPLVLIHGLCMNDLQWRTPGAAGAPAHDHGLRLAAELGYTPLYLHYNSGLHISSNGAQLAALLEQLLRAWPQPVEQLALVGHSMGGLLARSAWHQATQAGHAWPAQLLSHMVFLGTPHHGAPLERMGHWVDTLLRRSVSTRPFAAIGQIRSAGITDLRHGNLLESDWQGSGRFDSAADTRQALALPAAVACYAVAASVVRGAGQPLRHALWPELPGDGLVPLASALGRHPDRRRRLAFAPQNQWIAHGMNHLELLSRPEVTRQLVGWLGTPR